MIRCILFDFDGTVFDTVEGITKSVQYAVQKRGLHPPLQELRCFAGPPLVDMFMEHFGFDRTEAEQAVTDFRERYNPIGLYECRLFPGIKEALQELRRMLRSFDNKQLPAVILHLDVLLAIISAAYIVINIIKMALCPNLIRV